jgi:hypothetical protein
MDKIWSDMTSEVEERIHRALQSHPLERIEDGYRLVHAGGAGVGTLRFLPGSDDREGPHVLAIAQIDAEYGSAGFPSFLPTGVQQLNSIAVHGAYRFDRGRLRQTAQYSIYSNEPDIRLAVQIILNAFGGQLPIGRSTALATVSTAVLEQQRAHHQMPAKWQNPPDEESMKAATARLQEQGLVASNDAVSVWAELPMSGDCPSRAIDPTAETALLQVNVDIAHPIAGAGYLASISLPGPPVPANAAEICERLNAWELRQTGFVPRIGAWGLRGPKALFGYACFIPWAEPYPGLHLNAIWWCAQRAAWIRDRFWVAQQGLSLDSVPNPKSV